MVLTECFPVTVFLLCLPVFLPAITGSPCSKAENLAIRLLCHIGQIDIDGLRSYETYVEKPHPVEAPPTVAPELASTASLKSLKGDGFRPGSGPDALLLTKEVSENEVEKIAKSIISPFKEEEDSSNENSKDSEIKIEDPPADTTPVAQKEGVKPVTAPPIYTQVLSLTRPNRTFYDESEVCFGCMASTITNEDFPNENCSRDLTDVDNAVDMGIGFATCVHGCYTSVLRLGDYITTFRGCRGEIVPGEDSVDKGNYKCTVSNALGTEWWTCTCRGHFCNAKLPDV